MNYNKYIGLPYTSNGRDFSGTDCWGLACLFYRDELGIELPSYSELYSTASDPQVVEAIQKHRDNWILSADGTVGDLCLFNIYGEPAHVGVYIGNNHFLHAREGMDSVVESLSSSQWSKRFQGFYKYQAQPQVFAAGAPHPFKTQVAYDWTVAGTTVQDFANFVNKKYSVSERFAQQLAVTVDGVLIPRDQWSTTVLEANQTVAYKSVAQGRNATRLLLTIAVVVIAVNFGLDVGTAMGFTGNTAQAIGTMAINMAGMALVNAIAPIRMPGQGPDPGSAASLNLFSGASNQANRFGAIPVVLGKMRVTGLLGATPYIDTLTETSLINLLVVWGFGPLQVSDICVGTNPISNYYGTKEEGFLQNFPAPVTLQGWPNEGGTEAFNKLYPRDVEQQQVGVLLVNNAEDGNPWKNVVLAQEDTTNIDIALSFPEGMRQLVISGGDSGQVREARAAVEFQIRREDPVTGNFGAWSARPSYVLGNYSAPQPVADAYSNTIGPVVLTRTAYDSEVGGYGYNIPLYQWFTYALSDTGEIRRFEGAATESQNSEPSAELIAEYTKGGYASLSGNDSNTSTYTRLPQIPSTGFVKLHTICVYGTSIVETINHIQGFSGFTGLGLTTAPLIVGNGWDDIVTTVGVTVKIAAGSVYQENAQQPAAGATQTVFTTRSMSGVTPTTSRFWGSFLNTHGAWFGAVGVNFDRTQNVVFPRTGYYSVEASADDEGAVFIDNRLAVGIPSPGYNSTVSNLVYIEAGTYPVKITAKNNGGDAGVGCIITYTENGGLNNLATPDTILTFGTPGFYHKRKDAFNFVYRIKNLEPGKYEVRVKRVDGDSSEPAPELRNFNKVSLLSVTGYANPLDAQGRAQGPINSIPNTYLAKTAIRLQSTGKINGTVDGVNAIVQTIAHDWDRTTQKWVMRPTSNPASLFGYVLTHPGNAYRIKQADISQQIDVQTLQSWHEYCQDKGLEFNSVVTQTQSVMDILRDICAAGRASPSYVDGKWSVVIDRPRNYVTQHFTPHNSWDFEATKVLPRLPDAFRITIPDQERAYQANDIMVFNYGKNLQTAEVFEELTLPGVTSAQQAKRMARWHLAQLKLRPETYTLNVDFEYLVCTRGDLVRVSHDVPLWGTATGRIKSKTTNSLTLTEQAYLESGKTYQIRVRLNSVSTAANSDSALLTLAPITTSAWYSEITLTQAVPNSVEADNLFMLGEITQESQELVVLSVEPTDNLSARITLADYSPEIYSIDLDDSNTQLPAFNANVAGKSNATIQATITQAPIITGTASGSSLAEEISTGTFQNTLLVSFGNVPDLSISAQKIQVQIVLGDSDFNATSLFGTYEIDKSVGSLTVSGLKTQTIYKIRARYTNATGTISGPWSNIYYTTSEGKTVNNYIAPSLLLDLDRTHIVAKTTTDLNKPSNFKTYEFRLYKDTGTEDFWELDPVVNNILVVQGLDEGRFDLLNVPLPRMSTQGVTYRVACRALDNTNNYSAESALGTIVVTTIQ